MKPLLEKDIQKGIKDYLTLIGIFCWKQGNAGIFTGADQGKPRWLPTGLKGVSDILGICKDGRFLAIEVKREGGVVSSEQKLFQENIRRYGGVAFVAYSLDDVRENLKKFNVI